jgi:hypothetical protein
MMEENEMDNKKEKGKDIMVGGKVVLPNIFLLSLEKLFLHRSYTCSYF